MGVPFLPARSMLGTDTFRHSAARVIACPFTGERLAGPAGAVPRRGRHPRPRGRPLRQLPHPRHHRRRPRPGPGRQAAHHHLRAADPQRRDPPRPDADGHPVLLRRCRLRGALRQLSRQHAVRVFLRRGAPAPVAGGRNAISATYRRVSRPATSTASATSPSTCSGAAAWRGCRNCGGRSSCWNRSE